MGGRRNHTGDRSWQFPPQLLPGIPGVYGCRGIEEPPGADLPRGARRSGADAAGQRYRAGRPHPSFGRESDPGRWPGYRGGGLPRQRGEHDGRVVPGREATWNHLPGCTHRGPDQRRLSGCFGAQRHREGTGRQDRPPDRVRRDRGTACGSSATCSSASWS
jgi:hypothetical protein